MTTLSKFFDTPPPTDPRLELWAANLHPDAVQGCITGLEHEAMQSDQAVQIAEAEAHTGFTRNACRIGQFATVSAGAVLFSISANTIDHSIHMPTKSIILGGIVLIGLRASGGLLRSINLVGHLNHAKAHREHTSAQLVRAKSHLA